MRREWIGLTALYNRFHTPADREPDIDRLRDLQVQIDQAVARAYGWDDLDLGHDFHEVPYLPENDRVRFTVSEEARIEILDRLSQLNRERYEEEVAEGLHGKKKGAKGRPKKAKTPAAAPAGPQEPGRVVKFPGPQQPTLFPVSPQLGLFEQAAEPPPPTGEGTYGSPVVPPSGVRDVGLEGPATEELTPAQRIRTWLETHPGWHARGEVVEALGLSVSEWSSGIRALVEGGAVERRGLKRGVRYRVRD
jgi:hypothetical protein